MAVLRLWLLALLSALGGAGATCDAGCSEEDVEAIEQQLSKTRRVVTVVAFKHRRLTCCPGFVYTSGHGKHSFQDAAQPNFR